MTGTGAESEAGQPDPTPDHTPDHTPGWPPPADPGWAGMSAGFDGPPAEPRRSRVGLIAAVIVGVLVLGVGAGVAGTMVLLRSNETAAADASPRPAIGRGPSTEPTPTEEAAQEGPVASEYPATKVDDLNRVCDEEVFYPQSPKRSGKAPHPIVLLVSDTPHVRSQDQGYYYDEGLSTKDKQTWAAQDAKKVQLVACLDRVSTGSKIRACKFDNPKPDTLTLARATWRLRVYEVATRRQLLDKRMSGDDQACPFVALYGADKKIYAPVSARAMLNTLRGLVTK
ncbi:hypothetical protein DFJ67_7965 [Asanoa ferruginea]|uniref:Uncharacterized protein n=1 Tax=Asanoa ferruginea TaxID=53367 RepID=A0A3D9ZXH4_9ACTN|nr:hypothetical protein [Asanoa ferruginea]REG01876.1 hypothetical protein DFJ67_7965 [Asanoa ferruginea]GIF50247.1 hypothetical protein Afe04nite_47860 [Asanoa ferruginea]